MQGGEKQAPTRSAVMRAVIPQVSPERRRIQIGTAWPAFATEETRDDRARQRRAGAGKHFAGK